MLPPYNTPPNSNQPPNKNHTKGSETDITFHVSKTPLNKEHSKWYLQFVCTLGSLLLGESTVFELLLALNPSKAHIMSLKWSALNINDVLVI